MRLSDWQARAPHKDAMTPKVLAVVEPVMSALGSGPDPSCWVAWGDDPSSRYSILVPTDAGIVQVLVRVNVPGEGPRASGKVIRWGRLQVGELALEMAGGHRLLNFQVENYVLRGADDDGDAMAQFALELFARIDGRTFVPTVARRGRTAKAAAAKAQGPRTAAAAPPAGARTAAATSSTSRAGAAKSAAAKPAAAKPAAAKPGASKPAASTARKPASATSASTARRSSH